MRAKKQLRQQMEQDLQNWNYPKMLEDVQIYSETYKVDLWLSNYIERAKCYVVNEGEFKDE